MGTNHHFIRGGTEPCPTCGHAESPEKLHIGKSSLGWCYSLQVLPDEGLNSLSDWLGLFNSGTGKIEDECGVPLEPWEMVKIITKRGSLKEWDDEQRWNYSSLEQPSPYGGEAYFHSRNNSLRGPNNLLRHRIGPHCVGHGEGT